MSEPHVVEQLLASINGNLDEAAMRIVKDHLSWCDRCRGEFESLSTMWAELGQSPGEVPGASLANGFCDMLSTYEKSMGIGRGSRVPRIGESTLERLLRGRPALQIGFVTCILMFGLLGGYFLTGSGRNTEDMTLLREEVRELKNLLAVSLLQQESASERLKGVSWSSRLDGNDPGSNAALFNTMNHDRNVNVRLAALNALSRDLDSPAVRSEIISSFPRQTSPLMQFALVDVLVQINTRESRDVLEQALQRPHLHPDVQKRIKQGIQLIL